MPPVVSWPRGASPEREVRQAVDALQQGHIVAFPTEAGYGLAASALLSDAVQRLGPSPDGSPLPLALRGAGEALDWVPRMSPLGRRLARRCWPGPVMLAFGDVADGVASRLPDVVRRHVCPNGTLHVRVPAHNAVLQTLQHLPGPLILVDAPQAPTAELIVQMLGDRVALVLDDGFSPSPQSPTVVEVNGNTWSVLHEGAVTAAEVEQLCPCVLIFVCTGNTCRSPLAEALCKKLLAERLGCAVEELPRRGFIVLSAGLAAMMGGSAAKEAVDVARELGADLSQHVSRPLTAQLVAQADYVVTMTSGHLTALADQVSGPGVSLRLLSAAGDDIADPIGWDQPVYRECAQQILRHLEGLLAELQPS